MRLVEARSVPALIGAVMPCQAGPASLGAAGLLGAPAPTAKRPNSPYPLRAADPRRLPCRPTARCGSPSRRATGSAAWRPTERPSRNSSCRIPGARRASSRSVPTTTSGSPNIWAIASAGLLPPVRLPSFRFRQPAASRARLRSDRTAICGSASSWAGGSAASPRKVRHHGICHSDAEQRAARDCRRSGRQSLVLRIQRRQDRAHDANGRGHRVRAAAPEQRSRRYHRGS